MVDFTREDCMYEVDGNRWTVNYDLAVKNGLDKAAVLTIRSLQMSRIRINALAKAEPINSKMIAAYRKVLTTLELTLQKAWGFPLDDRCHPHQRIGV